MIVVTPDIEMLADYRKPKHRERQAIEDWTGVIDKKKKGQLLLKCNRSRFLFLKWQRDYGQCQEKKGDIDQYMSSECPSVITER